MLDACQMRLSPEQLRLPEELRLDGPAQRLKFLGGPPFAGALLVPARTGAQGAGAVARARVSPATHRGIGPRLQHLASGCKAIFGLLFAGAPRSRCARSRAVPATARCGGRPRRGDGRRTRKLTQYAGPVGAVPAATGHDESTLRLSAPASNDCKNGLDLAAADQCAPLHARTPTSRVAAAGPLCSARRLAALPCISANRKPLSPDCGASRVAGARLVWRAGVRAESLGSSLEAARTPRSAEAPGS